MKHCILNATLMLFSGMLCAQLNTEVYAYSISQADSSYTLSNPINLSNNEGYDNQPSFYNDNTIIFSSTRNGQTDIRQYQLDEQKSSWLSNTPVGSEYSPLKIPYKEEISAIRLDTTGLQRLYRYDKTRGTSEELLKDLKIGYHLWYTSNLLVATVLIENRMDLVVANIKEGTIHTMQKNVGRSLHKIPNTELISYLSKEEDEETWFIKSMNPISGATEKLSPMFPEVKDMCWLADGTMLVPKGKYIAKFKYGIDTEWSIFWEFKEEEINNITRLKVSDNGKTLALVAEVSPRIIVQKQVDTFNQEDLEGFVHCYAPNVLVQNFPADTLYTGRAAMRKGYQSFFTNSPKTQVTVEKRMVYNNVVIDEEKVVQEGKVHWQAALYEVKNGLIQSMTFIHGKQNDSAVVNIVQKQLDAYNKRDIDAFMDTYSDDIQVFGFPYKFDYEGKEKMRSGYQSFFEEAEGLHCEIKQRIVIGNKVIDEEYITVKRGTTFKAIVIYEVNDEKISKVTIIR